MHDNPQAADGLAFALPDHHLIALSGRDAVAFAQAQFMNDVGLLAPRSWQWNGWLTPKGRVVALFALLKLSDELIWLLLPDADPTELATALQRFVFRSKVKIEVRQDLYVSGSFAAIVGAAQGSTLGGDDRVETVEMDISGDAGPRSVRISGAVNATTHAQALARWQAYDLQHGLPRLPTSQAGQWTPQQLSLQRLQAFSVKKGCYPGQEIVARTHFLGQVKRSLALFEGDAPLAVGTEVMAGTVVLGQLVAGTHADGRHLALAVLPLAREVLKMTAGGITLREWPLRDGLGR